MSKEEIEKKFEILSKKGKVSIVICVKGEQIVDFDIKGFEYELIDDKYFELKLVGSNSYYYIDMPNFTQIDAEARLIMVDY